jgi:hypothetical protein
MHDRSTPCRSGRFVRRRSTSVPSAALVLLLAIAASPAAAGFSPGAAVTFTTSASPRSVAIGDLNNDGIPDMVTTSETGGGISVHRGLGGEAFAPKLTSYNTGAMGTVVLADFNNDGKLDAAVPFVVSASNYQILVLEGNGDCTFGSAWFFTAPLHSDFLVAADFNGDGKMDLATAGYATASTGTAAVFLNTTTSFTNFARTDYAVGAQPRGITAGNVTTATTLTLKPDLITANNAVGSISILKNDGTGHFGNRLDIATQTSTFAVTAGWLFPALSRAQIVTANRDSAAVTFLYFDDGTSSWKKKNLATAAGPRGVSIGDVDGDLNPDLLVAAYDANKISILATDNFSSAVFLPRVDVTVGANPYAATVVNFDGNMKPDLLTADRGASQVRLTHGTPTIGWALGDTIPDFSASNQHGDAVQFAKLRGKWLLLDLCSVWCNPCKLMAHHTQDCYRTWFGNPSVRFEYLTGLMDGAVAGMASTQADAQWWADQFDINRPILHSSGSLVSGIRAVAQASQLMATPTLRLIDPSGRIVWLTQGAADDTTIHRVLANAAGVGVPPPFGPPSVVSGTATATYGPNVVSSPADPASGNTFPFFVSGFGENLTVDLGMARDPVQGTENWTVDLAYWPYAGAPHLPARQLGTDYPWQVTLSNLVLDPLTRTLAPGAVATVTVVDTFGVDQPGQFTVPVTWSNGTLTLGALSAATLAARPPIWRLRFDVPMTIAVGGVAGVGPLTEASSLDLRSPWPNPARATSRVEWSQARAGAARLEVFDVNGRRVRTLVDGVTPAGENHAAWDLGDESGRAVGAGLYFLRLAVAGVGQRAARVMVVR